MKLQTVSLVLALLSASARCSYVSGIFDDYDGEPLTLDMVKSMPVPEYAHERLAYCLNDIPLEVFTYVLENWGIDINKKDNSEMTALDHAVSDDNLPVARALLQRGADSSDWNLVRAVKNDNLELVKLVQEAKVVPEVIYGNAIREAARRGQTEISKYLLEARPDFDVNTPSTLNGETPLIAAASFVGDNREILQMLVDRGAEFSFVDRPYKQNCLMKAWRNPDSEGQYYNFMFLLRTAGDRVKDLMSAEDDTGKSVLNLLENSINEYPAQLWPLIHEIKATYLMC